MDALLGPLRSDSGVPSALSTLDHTGRSCTRDLGPLRDIGREGGSIGGAILDLDSANLGPGSIEVSKLLDPGPCEVLVVLLELIEDCDLSKPDATAVIQAERARSLPRWTWKAKGLTGEDIKMRSSEDNDISIGRGELILESCHLCACGTRREGQPTMQVQRKFQVSGQSILAIVSPYAEL